jgi:hypothetical protein
VSTVRHTGVQVRSRAKSVKSKLGRGCGKFDVAHGVRTW